MAWRENARDIRNGAMDKENNLETHTKMYWLSSCGYAQ